MIVERRRAGDLRPGDAPEGDLVMGYDVCARLPLRCANMEMSPVAVVTAIALGLMGSVSQTPDVGGRPPSAKKEAIVIRGCVSGPLLRELRVQKSHMEVEAPETAVVYRLTGDKKLLHLIQKEHQDQLLEVAGEITSNSTGVTRSKEFGRLTVYGTDGRPEVTKGKPDSYPDLRVTSFEVIRPHCEE